MEERLCICCNKKLPVTKEFFYCHAGMASGFLNKCKKCILIASKQHRKKNPIEISQRRRANYQKNKAAIASRQMELYFANHEDNKRKRREWNASEKGAARRKEERKRYRAKHREEINRRDLEWKKSPDGKAYLKKYKQENIDRIRKNRSRYDRVRRAKDPLYKLITNIRASINHAISQNFKKGRAIELVGCSIEYLKAYIEVQFKPGMSWDNWTRDGWHVDHIRPCSSFDLTNPEQQRECFHYSNLQPLWAIDNLKKWAKII